MKDKKYLYGFTKKTTWKDGPLDGRKSNEKINAAKWGKPHPKIYKKKNL